MIGLYDELGDGSCTALLVGPDGAISVSARRVVLAPGSHDPVHLFENNDLPGVLSARAALSMLRQGVLAGARGRGRG